MTEVKASPNPEKTGQKGKFNIFDSFFYFFANNGYDKVFWPSSFDKSKEKNALCLKEQKDVSL